MKYRLIRFSPNGEVLLDEQVSAPNQMGCNREWIKANPECSGVLLEKTKVAFTNRVDDGYIFYELNKREILTNNGKAHSTWFGIQESEVLDKYKYLQMLKLTGSL